VANLPALTNDDHHHGDAGSDDGDESNLEDIHHP